MIKTVEKIKQPCHQCPMFKPTIECSDMFGDVYVNTVVEVNCENRAICDYIELYLSGRMGENK